MNPVEWLLYGASNQIFWMQMRFRQEDYFLRNSIAYNEAVAVAAFRIIQIGDGRRKNMPPLRWVSSI